jgi:hypothetical protein
MGLAVRPPPTTLQQGYGWTRTILHSRQPKPHRAATSVFRLSSVRPPGQTLLDLRTPETDLG